MRIVLYRGSRGTGKSLSMTKDALKYYAEGWEVLTNLSNTIFKKVDSEYLLALTSDSDLKNCVLLIDEIELFFDSRDWNKSQSKSFSRFLQQIRKRNIVILCTAQFTNLIDVRLRQQIDTLVVCSFDVSVCVCSCIYVDLTSLESSPSRPKSFRIKYYAVPIFDYYDTFHLVS